MGAEEAAPSSGHPPGEPGIDYAAPGSETTRVPTHPVVEGAARGTGEERDPIGGHERHHEHEAHRHESPSHGRGQHVGRFLASSRMAIWPRVASRPSRPTALRRRARLPGVRPRAAAMPPWMTSPRAIVNRSRRLWSGSGAERLQCSAKRLRSSVRSMSGPNSATGGQLVPGRRQPGRAPHAGEDGEPERAVDALRGQPPPPRRRLGSSAAHDPGASTPAPPPAPRPPAAARRPCRSAPT